MPRKFRPGKGRRNSGFEFDELSLKDLLRLDMSEMPQLPISEGDGDCLKTLEDFEQAWEINRNYFMAAGFQAHDEPVPYDDYFRFEPCKRPWPYWIFDMQYPAVPENQVGELRKLRELLPGEFECAQRLAREFPNKFNPAELRSLTGAEIGE
jgi:hypothetical protein